MNLLCDLFVDGNFEGKIESHKAITVGKNGTVTGEVHAQHIIVQGVVEGSIDAERVEIKEAIRLVMLRHHMLVEPAAVLSVASFLKTADRYAGKTVVLILSGAKISLETLRQVLA